MILPLKVIGNWISRRHISGLSGEMRMARRIGNEISGKSLKRWKTKLKNVITPAIAWEWPSVLLAQMPLKQRNTYETNISYRCHRGGWHWPRSHSRSHLSRRIGGCPKRPASPRGARVAIQRSFAETFESVDPHGFRLQSPQLQELASRD